MFYLFLCAFFFLLIFPCSGSLINKKLSDRHLFESLPQITHTRPFHFMLFNFFNNGNVARLLKLFFTVHLPALNQSLITGKPHQSLKSCCFFLLTLIQHLHSLYIQ